MARVVAITPNPALDLSIDLARLAPGAVNRARGSRTTAAGKGNNVARVLAAHGHDVTVTGFLGVDNAAVFEAAFAEWGVADAFVRVPGETRTNTKLAEAAGRVTEINAPGPTIGAADASRLAHAIEHALSQAVDAVVMAGSLPPGLSGALLADALAPATRAGVPLWLDASDAALVAGLTLGPALVKPNTDELAAWAGGELADEADLIAAARAMRAAGAGEVAVSRGAGGLLWLAGDAVRSAAGPPVKIVSTVCAGDTLLAGLLHGRLSGWAEDDTLAFASALAADAVTRIGVGRSDGPDFAALRNAVTVRSLATIPSARAAGSRGRLRNRV